jgi:hypothetical protein
LQNYRFCYDHSYLYKGLDCPLSQRIHTHGGT